MLTKDRINKIAIVGQGGIGSDITIPLAKWLCGVSINNGYKFEVVLIDGDIVEAKNVERQSFLRGEVGTSKSEIQATVFNNVVSHLGAESNIYAVHKYRYIEPRNITSSLGTPLITLVGIDDVKTRYLIEQHLITYVPTTLIVFGGNELYDGDINVVLKKDGELITPLYSQNHPEIIKAEKSRTEMSCNEIAATSGPQLLFVNRKVAQAMLEVVFCFVTYGMIPFYEQQFDIRLSKTKNIFSEKKEEMLYERIKEGQK